METINTDSGTGNASCTSAFVSERSSPLPQNTLINILSIKQTAAIGTIRLLIISSAFKESKKILPISRAKGISNPRAIAQIHKCDNMILLRLFVSAYRIWPALLIRNNSFLQRVSNILIISVYLHKHFFQSFCAAYIRSQPRKQQRTIFN